MDGEQLLEGLTAAKTPDLLHLVDLMEGMLPILPWHKRLIPRLQIRLLRRKLRKSQRMTVE